MWKNKSKKQSNIFSFEASFSREMSLKNGRLTVSFAALDFSFRSLDAPYVRSIL